MFIYGLETHELSIQINRVMKKTSVGRVTSETIRQASSAMGARNPDSGQWSKAEIRLVAGGKSKIISTRISAAEIKEAWSKAASE